MKWSKETHRPLGAHIGVWDSDIYDVLTLSLIINRHVPDCFDDDDVSVELDRVIRSHGHLIPIGLVPDWLR